MTPTQHVVPFAATNKLSIILQAYANTRFPGVAKLVLLPLRVMPSTTSCLMTGKLSTGSQGVNQRSGWQMLSALQHFQLLQLVCILIRGHVWYAGNQYYWYILARQTIVVCFTKGQVATQAR